MLPTITTHPATLFGALLAAAALSGCGGVDCSKCDPVTERCSPFGCISCVDEGESNESMATAYRLVHEDDDPEFTDDPDSSRGYKRFALHDPQDVDNFQFSVSDTCCGGNPRITVSLEQLTSNQNFELRLGMSCKHGSAAHSCSGGRRESQSCVIDGGDQKSVTLDTNCKGFSLDSNDGGTARLQIHAIDWGPTPAICGAYDLQIRVR